MSINGNKAIPILVVLLGLLAAGCGNADSIVENQEYGFKVIIPDDLPVCMADTATHVHGVGTVLTGNDCSNREQRPAFNIWADYNVLFVESALEDLRGNSTCSGAFVDWAEDEWRGAIGGLNTAMCRVEHSDGRINVVLAAQAGERDNGFGTNVPDIIYTVYFISTTPRIDGDLKVLRTFLESIEITQQEKDAP